MRILKSLGALALLAVFVSFPARAFVWNEINAGQLPATAEVIFGGGPLTQINGHLDFDLDTSTWDVDLFAIQITDAALFSAQTEAGPANMIDPALYLFDSGGLGVYMNNDNPSDFQSTLPAGHVFGPLAPGLYYLAIAWGFSDALSFDSIFSLDQFLDTTGVYGPTGPGGGAALADWDTSSAPNNFDLPANYTIDLVAAAPEPGTLSLLLVAAIGIMARRRKAA